MNNILMNAIFSMDAYNRGYNPGIDLRLKDASGNPIPNSDTIYTKNGVTYYATIGNATVYDTKGDTTAQAASFYAIAYDYNGGTIISYRGTDDLSLDSQYGWAANSALNTQPQAQMAFDFYNSVAGGIDPRTANISLTGHSLGGGLAGLVGANDNAQQARSAA